ncbi:MAG: orotate phosphoribosyltransferase-like protein [Candidatus Thermoplasmatota archaeon]|nr:orotate phosphoribosyltransferase-like protein [Candidatus Thermoplasmatota archaeon]MEC8788631.1 orotate phosphoribosyltransferase-like protein [Candidatus Thermoplasmatota archaeon]|tara:strand:+ start:1157 stop:1744 length:588 start_codon:yes stop_codon:yes gene_type:complete
MEQGLSIEQLRDMVSNLRKDGLNSQQIADELSLSQDTISWLIADSSVNEKPQDVRIGWRTIGVRPQRIAAIGAIMADVAAEECGDLIDTVVGISINGVLFANEVASQLGCEVAIHRNVDGEAGQGSLSNKYGQVAGKRVAIVDDVLSTGVTMSKTIDALREAGAEVALCLVLVNKTVRNEIDEVPLRGIIRAAVV